MTLEERLAALDELAGVATDRLPASVVERIEATAAHASGRLAHGTTKTVAALAGATGSGKSSLFNEIAGEDLAAIGVRRPTTSTTSAAAFAATAELDAASSGLLDWLGVASRHAVADGDLDGLILLDLPDHDSTSLDHRAEVDRLVEVVDVFVWVVDPQKYADAVLHRDYLRRFAGHSDVTLVVLNQVDTVAAGDDRALLDDLTRLLADDGLTTGRSGLRGKLGAGSAGVRVFGMSARTGDGVAELRRELAARAAERRAMPARLEADIDWIAADVGAAVGDRAPGEVGDKAVLELGASLADAAGADAIADAVASSHARAGRVAVGWPPTRWLARLRPDPLRRLGLGGRRRSGDDRGEPTVAPRVVSLPPMSPVATAGVSSAVRTVADRAGDGLPEPWRRRVAAAAASRRDDLDDSLERAVATARLPTGSPRWWRAIGPLQWALAAAMTAGLVWLLASAVANWLGLPDLPTPKLGAIPWPTVLAVGGALAGIVVGTIARWVNVASGRRRATRTRKALGDAALGVARDLVVAPIDAELTELARVRTLAAALHRAR